MKLSALLLAALLVPVSVTAQTNEPTALTTSVTSSPATELETADAFITRTRAPMVWLRFRRFLTRDSVKDTELTLAIANRLALAIQNTPTKAETLLEQYDRESQLLQDLTTIITPQVTDAATLSFLSQLLIDKTAQLTLLEQVNPQASSELSRKLINTRAKALRNIALILENENLTDAEREIKLAEVTEKYARKAAKIDAKLTKKLAFKNELDDASEDDDLEEALGHEEDEIVDDAAEAMQKDELKDFMTELQRQEGDDSLVVLEKLLALAPEARKGGIETAIDAVVTRQIASFQKDPAAMEAFLKDHSGSDKVREILLERIKEHSKDESLKQQIERKKESLKKESESTQKKQESSESHDSDSSSSESQTESSNIDVKIEADGKPDKTSFTVKKGSRLTVEVESKYAGSATISIDGIGTKTLTEDQKTNFSPFIINEAKIITINGVAGKISVQ